MLLITDATVLTMDPSRRILEPGAVAVDGSRIVEIGTPEEVRANHTFDRTISIPGRFLMPGLINTHSHSQNALIRGTADDEAGPGWLNKYINPMHAAMTENDAYAIARLTYAEALKTGTTCIVDMGRHMHRCADAAIELGIRGVMAPYAANVPEFSYLETIEGNEQLVKERHNDGDGLVSTWFGIEYLPYSTPEHYLQARELATKYGVGIHLHANTRAEEVAYARGAYGKPTIELLHEWGVLGPDVLAAHCVVLSRDEIRMLAVTDTQVAYCPVPGMKVALGICPVIDLQKAGVNVALGTDGAAENNSVDLMETLKYASLLQRLATYDPNALPSKQVVEMATLGGARAVGKQDEIGSIEVGKRADLIVVDPRRPGFAPLFGGEDLNFVPLLVYSGHGDIVETVVVNGRVVVEDYELTGANEEEIIAEATEAARKLLERRKAYVDARDPALDRGRYR